MEVVHCPLFSEQHGQHNSVWSVPGYTLPVLCVACVIERLGNKSELNLHTRKILTELRALLTGDGHSKLLAVLKSDKRVLERLCSNLFGLLTSQEEAIKEQASETLKMLVDLAQDGDITLKLLNIIIHTVMSSQSFPCSLPHLTLLGKLLHSHPALANTVARSYSNFLEFILGGLTYPHDPVKSSVVYLLVQVCSKSQPNSLPLPLVQSMCRHISTNLATAKSQELTINLLGLVRHLLKRGTYTQFLLQADKLDSQAKGSTFASAFKRVLLSRDELLQLSAVQCVEEVLCHHMEYGRVLLTADIAEFLFEALSSKNELLISSLFSCLNSLASVDDFYTKCHVLYGIDAILNGLSASLKLKAHSATQIGFSFLVKILRKQPRNAGLFPTSTSLQKLLEVVSTALQSGQEPIVLYAISAVRHLLQFRQVPPGLPTSALFPTLAMLLHTIEPLTTPTQLRMGVALTEGQPSMTITPDQKKQLCEALETFREAFRYTEESLAAHPDNTAALQEKSSVIFLFRALEESLVPATLLHMDVLDDPGPFTALFTMATYHMTMSSPASAHTVAKKLVQGAFIQLVFEIKAKFLNVEGYEKLCLAGNDLLVNVCSLLAEERERSEGQAQVKSSSSVIRSALQAALPSINCTIENCLQHLCQRAPTTFYHSHLTGTRCATGGIDGGMGTGTSSIAVLQHATLVLLHCACSHGDILVAPVEVMRSLHKYLSLNPNIHLLHPAILRCLVSLFAEASISQLDWVVGASHPLLEGLLRVSEPIWKQLCCHGDSTVLLWGFSQPSLHHTLAKTWLQQWIQLSNKDTTVALVGLLKKSSPAVQCLLSLLVETSDTPLPLEGVLHVLELFVSKDCEANVRIQVIHSLQELVTKQRVDPIPDTSLVVLLKLMATAMDSHDSGEPFDIKVVYKGDSSRNVAESGMNLICSILRAHFNSIQIPTLLLNNTYFLEKVESFLSDVTTPKMHSDLSASALRLIALLIDLHYKLNRKTIPHVIKLSISTILSALSSPLETAKVAGLELWKVIFLQEGRTAFLELNNIDRYSKDFKCPRVVFFLVLNCLMHDSNAVRSAASECIVEVMNYMAKFQGTLLQSRHWMNTLTGYLVESYHISFIPPLYIPFIDNLLNLVKTSSDCSHLHPLSQLLYKSYHMTECHPRSQHIKACFAKISSLDKGCLTSDQWASIATSEHKKSEVCFPN